MSLPRYLYHATSQSAAASIVDGYLEPRSGDGGYLCMSADESGATTLNRRASDIVFRVKRKYLDKDQWSKDGAGQAEWRGTQRIRGSKLEWRRYLGTGSRDWGRDEGLFG